jgi:hypothetical protein
MVEMWSSELLPIAVVLLANGRIGCVWVGMSSHPSHPQMALKWTAGDGGRMGSKGGGSRDRLAVGDTSQMYL